jgi:hypothetical protein
MKLCKTCLNFTESPAAQSVTRSLKIHGFFNDFVPNTYVPLNEKQKDEDWQIRLVGSVIKIYVLITFKENWQNIIITSEVPD